MTYQNHQNLSPAQAEAVQYVGSPTIVTAGAGSGKTRTLTSKIAFLVKDLGYDPGKILAITFTNKAASEMKARLEKATGRRMDEFPWVRTFHSACFRILKEHCDLLGYEKPLTIHDANQQKTHLKRVLAELDLDKKYLQPAASMVSHAKNSGDPLRYLNAHGRVPHKQHIYRLYNELLEGHNCVDFDDILLLTRDLLRKFPEIRSRYREAFDYILVDEFQDSNAIQNEIVDLLLRNGNLTVVGDDYQSIYKFRGADPQHFINFPEKYEGARVFRLEENFRSTTQIVAASDTLIAKNVWRMEKQCFSRRDGGPIHVRCLPDDESEARWVADQCWRLASIQKIPLENLAILTRTKFVSLPFERALRQQRLPYTMVGAQGFFLRREVQDLNSYLICAVNRRDDLSFERIINIPKRGIGPGAIKKIQGVRGTNESLRDAARKAVERHILPKKAGAELARLLDLLKAIARERPDDALRRVVQAVNYEEYLQSFAENAEDFDSRRENIKEMIYDASQKNSIADYLEDAALIRDDQDEEDRGSGVKLSTIHAAKGLEFKAVFVVALEEGLLPHHRSLRQDIMDGDEDGEGHSEGIEEERRLMYVAMTRATDHLFLSCATIRRGEFTLPSRFLEEIPDHLKVEE